ncbi:MAG: 2-oxoacid:ferredoxin oxidoreductase subunit beta [Phascolarctobacterium sp.]|nr:2-oxoacid:ferredoxin oxidoreductase subunit beta [Phascolarctobacterium sp.]
MSEMEKLVEKYFRPGRLPHIWCPGCGNGVITGAIVKAIDKQGLAKDDVALISGIGCSSRSSGYLDFNTANTLHGRALTIATGVKMANPALNVIVCSGDGDCTAIGGNHFIHACRRNINMTLVVYNNSIYGMTGGQYSPMTPRGSKATTAPYSTIEPSFNLLDLAKAAGATFVARATTYHVPVLVDCIAKGIAHNGFSVIEAVSACPISFGRQNKMGGPAEMMAWQRDHGVMVAAWNKMDEAKLGDAKAQGKFPIGVLYETNDVPEYTEQYDEIIKRAQGGK